MGESKKWFRAKKYGWGWGLPYVWQGWVVLISFIVLVIGGSRWFRLKAFIYIPYIIILTIVLVGICFWKGEKPGWRWGNDDESHQ